jgi:uncharacterized protein DUF4442
MSSAKPSSPKIFDPESPTVKKDLTDINSWKVRLYLLQNLPTAFWWSLKVKSCSPYRTEIEIPFNWRTQNPFKSIYFAALAGAGELSTGLMAGLVIRNTPKKISMLVTNVEVDFIKKANNTTTFTCDEGIKIIEGIQKAIDTNEGVEVILNSTGVKKGGEVVAQFRITWSFRVKPV